MELGIGEKLWWDWERGMFFLSLRRGTMKQSPDSNPIDI
jgi:hypothetical protein